MSDDQKEPEPVEPLGNTEPEPEPELPEMGQPEFKGGRPDGSRIERG
jgi:hypothetical protein